MPVVDVASLERVASPVASLTVANGVTSKDRPAHLCIARAQVAGSALKRDGCECEFVE